MTHLATTFTILAIGRFAWWSITSTVSQGLPRVVEVLRG